MTGELDAINRGVWSSQRVQRIFSSRSGWMDAGEAIVMERIADAARGRTILDIGVGAGRTVPYLSSLSDDYIAVDYLDELVQLTRSRFPEVRAELGDARELSQFADSSVDVALFSFNGIDGLAHEDRPLVFRAAARVLRPGGLFAYSTHNLDYRLTGRPPWSPERLHPRNGARSAARAALYLPKGARSYRRLRRREVRGDGWALLVDQAYDFTVLWHYVTLAHAVGELRSAGFGSEVEAYTTAGTRVEPGDDTAASPWLHFIVRSLGPTQAPDAPHQR
jgi:SAM-dependent methyltransferase